MRHVIQTPDGELVGNFKREKGKKEKETVRASLNYTAANVVRPTVPHRGWYHKVLQ